MGGVQEDDLVIRDTKVERAVFEEASWGNNLDAEDSHATSNNEILGNRPGLGARQLGN